MAAYSQLQAWINIARDEIGEHRPIRQRNFEGAGTGSPHHLLHPLVKARNGSPPRYRNRQIRRLLVDYAGASLRHFLIGFLSSHPIRQALRDQYADHDDKQFEYEQPRGNFAATAIPPMSDSLKHPCAPARSRSLSSYQPVWKKLLIG